jgi:cytochrome P450
MNQKALYDMKLLDSVMKESQRLNSFNFTRFTRVALKPLTLRDGTFIPKGTFLELPTDAIGRDPEIYPDPDRFDPYRFYRLRQTGDQNVHRHQFVTVTREDTNFGWGRHSCPGRFFAANEIKLLLVNMLLKYDIKMKDEDAKEGRFKNWEGVNLNSPDLTKELLMRRRVSA